MSTAPRAGADAFRAFYRDRRVMITGGLGFIGSNLARQLAALGARVLIIDSLISEYGGNLFNIRVHSFPTRRSSDLKSVV